MRVERMDVYLDLGVGRTVFLRNLLGNNGRIGDGGGGGGGDRRTYIQTIWAHGSAVKSRPTHTHTVYTGGRISRSPSETHTFCTRDIVWRKKNHIIFINNNCSGARDVCVSLKTSFSRLALVFLVTAVVVVVFVDKRITTAPCVWRPETGATTVAGPDGN